MQAMRNKIGLVTRNVAAAIPANEVPEISISYADEMMEHYNNPAMSESEESYESDDSVESLEEGRFGSAEMQRRMSMGIRRNVRLLPFEMQSEEDVSRIKIRDVAPEPLLYATITIGKMKRVLPELVISIKPSVVYENNSFSCLFSIEITRF